MHYGLTSEPGGEYLDGLRETPALASLPEGETYVRYEYDAQGRKTDDIAPNDSGAETWTHYVYDDQGRQTKIIYNYKPGTYPNHGAANDENIVYETVYNKYGERTQLIDAKGHSTWFEYDAFGRLYRKILDNDGDGNKEPGSPDSYEEYSYDNARGLLTKKRNFDGSTVSYTYDPETDRQTKAVYSDGYEVRFEYEEITGRLVCAREYRDGKLTRTTSYAYDPITGRPARVAKPEGVLNYTYTPQGQLSKVWTSGMTGDAVLPLPPGEGGGEGQISPPYEGGVGGGGVYFEYFYDPAGRLIEAKTPSGSAEYAYYPNGSRESLTLPNGVTTDYTYNALMRLDLMQHKDSTETLLAEFDYEVGRSGKRLAVSETIGSATADWEYRYDGLDRIADATRTIDLGATVYNYAYDLVGNRLSKSMSAVSTSYTYNALDQLTQETTGGTPTTYGYDGNGNQTSKTVSGQTTNYIYDSRNRLRQMFSGDPTEANLQCEYAYDYSGARIAKAEQTSPGVFDQTDFLIDTNNLTGYSQSFLELDHDTGGVDKRFEYGDDLYCQVSTNATPLDTPEYFLYDGLGSTRSLTDNYGTIIQSYNYRPFGEGIDHPSELSTNHLFTGEYYDSNLDYYYLRARYYDPGIGRFASHDSMEDHNNRLHKYTYCANSPVGQIDLSGSFLICVSSMTSLILSSVASLDVTTPQIPKSPHGIYQFMVTKAKDMLLIPHADKIKKWALAVEINKYFLAAVLANECSSKTGYEDTISLMHAGVYGEHYTAPAYSFGSGQGVSFSSIQDHWGHSYGLGQLHVWKARRSALHIYGKTDEKWQYKDPYGDKIEWASRDPWHFSIASQLASEHDFNIQHVAGYLKYIMKPLGEGGYRDEFPNYNYSEANFDSAPDSIEYYQAIYNVYTDKRDKGGKANGKLARDRIARWVKQMQDSPLLK